jgi:hypothetical protein
LDFSDALVVLADVDLVDLLADLVDLLADLVDLLADLVDLLTDLVDLLADLVDLLTDLVDLLADLALGALAPTNLVLLPAFDLEYFLLPDFLLPFSDASTTISPFLPRDFVAFFNCDLVWGGTGKLESVDDGVVVDECLAVIEEEVFELPPSALDLEDFVDFEAGVADLDFVTRWIGRLNSVGSFFRRVLSFCSAVWTEEVVEI